MVYVKDVKYKADLTAGSLKVTESRIIADLLLRDADEREWHASLYDQNVLQTRSPATAKRLAHLIRGRLETMDRDLWLLIREGTGTIPTHAVLAAAVKHSALLGDFFDLVVGEQYRTFGTALSAKLWEDYLDGCRGRDPEMPLWRESTRKRLKSTVFQILAQAGYVDDTRSLTLQRVHIAAQVIQYLKDRDERYVLRCIQVAA